MKVDKVEEEPTFTLTFSAREVQVIEQALFIVENTDSAFSLDASNLQDTLYDTLQEAGVEPLDGDTK